MKSTIKFYLPVFLACNGVACAQSELTLISGKQKAFS